MTKKKNKKKNSLRRKIANIEIYLSHASRCWEVTKNELERYKNLANSIEKEEKKEEDKKPKQRPLVTHTRIEKEEKKEEDKKPKQRPLVTHTRLVGPPPTGFDDWFDFLEKMWENQCLCGVEIKALSIEDWRERHPNNKHNNRVNKFFNKVERFFSNN